jgi:glucosamine--fructose-6-phosphate aminotransferase (isomerizing)
MLSRLEREMREQGDSLAGRAARGRVEAQAAAELLRSDDVDYLMVVARGSSDNAARYGQYLFGAEAGLVVALAAPWLFSRGGRSPRLSGAAVLAISQSGRSPDVAAVLASARNQHRPTLAITNDTASPMAALADVVVDLNVGQERSVPATKTYTASLHALAQIAAALVPDQGWSEWLDRLPELVSETVEAQLAGRERFDPLARFSPLTAVGRGFDYATAFETALKARELSGSPAEAYSPPDLLHGPVAAIDASTALWIASSGLETSAETLDTLRGVTARAGLTTAVSPDARVLGLADIAVPMPTVPAWVGPIVAVVPGQAVALRLAELNGVDVDAPHGLQKVTLTR